MKNNRHYSKYTDEDIIKSAAVAKSMASLLKALGLKPAGVNYINIKRKLQQLKVSCPHWTGQAWNKAKQLKDCSNYTKVSHLKKHLLKLRGHKCENCNLANWLTSSIPLEVHHKDGDRTNNDINNLQLVCPNCHSFTDYYRNRKLSAPVEKQEVECAEFGES